jgi:uncharacterized iron-regulated membrane protein
MEPSGIPLYRKAWRWHFYAGLFVLPFLVMLSLTGIIYLFKPQLDELMYRDLRRVAVGGATLPAVQLAEAARAGSPEATLKNYRPADAADRSAEFGLNLADGRELTAFVDPYTGRWLGTRDENRTLQHYALKLHGELLAGTVGDSLIEIAVCWALVLVLTGAYLWWPRRSERVWGVWLPRWNARGRAFWRDLHAVTGVYAALFLVFFVLSGLPWTGFWGKRFAAVWDRYPKNLWNAPPSSPPPALNRELNAGNVKLVPWAAEAAEIPPSRGAPGAVPLDLDAIALLARERGAPLGHVITLPKDATGVYTVSATPDDPRNALTLHLDAYTGATLAEIRWRDYGAVPQAVEWGIALHEGKAFGWINQLLGLVGCLLVLTVCIAGGVLWWKRKPPSGLGAPARTSFPHPRVRRRFVVGAIVFALAFPLAGASLVAVGLLDRVIGRWRKIA